MKKSFIILFFILIVSAIVVISIRQQPETSSNVASKIVEEEQVIPEELTLSAESGRTINLLIKDIPLYEEYLESQTDIKTEIERTQSEIIDVNSDMLLILMKYNCGSKQCSTLLVRKKNDEISNISLKDGIYQDHQLSHDKKSILFRFGYNEGAEIVRHVLIGVNISKMERILIRPVPLADQYITEPVWPVLNYTWEGDSHFSIEVPDLRSSDFEVLKNWYNSSNKKN